VNTTHNNNEPDPEHRVYIREALRVPFPLLFVLGISVAIAREGFAKGMPWLSLILILPAVLLWRLWRRRFSEPKWFAILDAERERRGDGRTSPPPRS
jgi:hypothetical protein